MQTISFSTGGKSNQITVFKVGQRPAAFVRRVHRAVPLFASACSNASSEIHSDDDRNAVSASYALFRLPKFLSRNFFRFLRRLRCSRTQFALLSDSKLEISSLKEVAETELDHRELMN